MANTSQKNLAIGATLVGLVILSSLLWYRIFHRDTFVPNNGGQTASSDQTPTSTQPPVIRGDAPKLAGSVLVGPKVVTRFYLARDGKRYVFPDETKTFDTWYPSGAKIVRVTQEELESYPLGGNVCYRPGTRLIRITSDTRMFAVAHNCTLRPINDGTAQAIFGANWKSLVDTLQDYYFTNYTVGPQISTARDYSIASEQGTSLNIDADKNIQ